MTFASCDCPRLCHRGRGQMAVGGGARCPGHVGAQASATRELGRPGRGIALCGFLTEDVPEEV